MQTTCIMGPSTTAAVSTAGPSTARSSNNPITMTKLAIIKSKSASMKSKGKSCGASIPHADRTIGLLSLCVFQGSTETDACSG